MTSAISPPCSHALRGETVTHILVTHSHADHSPLARRLQAGNGRQDLCLWRGEHPPTRQACGSMPRSTMISCRT